MIGNEFDSKPGVQAKTAEFKTVSVAKLFDDLNVPSEIDYLSLDIEGAEFWAFEQFAWDRYVVTGMWLASRPSCTGGCQEPTMMAPNFLKRIAARRLIYVVSPGGYSRYICAIYDYFPMLLVREVKLRLDL